MTSVMDTQKQNVKKAFYAAVGTPMVAGRKFIVQINQINGQFADRLRRIDMKNDFVLARNLCNRFDVVDHTYFIVYMHQGHENRVWSNRRSHFFR